MTADEAAKLKISFMGTHGASFDRSQQVIVSQVGRLKSCVARDGKTQLFYGHVVRTTVLLSNYKIEGEASLAIVAAQATIKGASNRVELEAIGIPDEDVQLKLQEAKNTLGGPSLKVENFQDFDKKRGEAETAAVRSRRASSELIGIEGEALDEPAIAVLLARAFALQQISYLYDCQRAIRDHGNSSPAIANAIQQTYEQIAGKCQPDAVAQARARKLLGPFSIRR